MEIGLQSDNTAKNKLNNLRSIENTAVASAIEKERCLHGRSNAMGHLDSRPTNH